MEIRPANSSDITWLCEQARLSASEALSTKYCYIPPTEELLHQEIQELVANNVSLVADKNDERAGAICALAGKHPYDSTLSTLTMRLWWVPQEHRNSGIGHALLRAFLNRGKSFDIVSVGFIDRGFINPKTLKRMGFSFVETHFVMEN